MSRIELGQLWPFGKKDTKPSPLSYQIKLSDEERFAVRTNCEIALANEFTVDNWRTFVDGMARLHRGTGYNDGTVFAEILSEERAFYFQTDPTKALIKVRGALGTEIITWGRTHTGGAIEAPTLSVIRRTNLDFIIDSLTFKPENPKHKKIVEHTYEKLGSLTMEDYDMSPEEARGYCVRLFEQEAA